MALEMTYTETLTVTHCWCGIAVGVPSNLYRHAHDAKDVSIYCPLGHRFGWSENNAAKLERAERRIKATKDLLAAEERSHAATRGHLTRARSRAAAGVCPCCHRSFENLARHVKTKHPDFKPSELPK